MSRFGIGSVGVPSLLVWILSAAASPERHLRLVRAEPAADSTVAQAPSALRLWFSERPEIGLTTVRLLDAQQKTIATSKARRDDKDALVVVVDVEAPAPQGTLTVSWRTMSRDGHAVSGTYQFTHAGEAGQHTHPDRAAATGGSAIW